MKQESKNHGWIKCSERLPDKCGCYLVISKRNYSKWYRVIHYYEDGWSAKNITHWQPLPEFPEEE